MMEARAISRFVRISSRKANEVAKLINGKPVSEALSILKFLPQRGSLFIEKTVRSAAANAVDIVGKDKLDMDSLYVKDARVTQGATMKRYRARAYGRASMIRKRTSHITIIVAEKK